MLTIKSSWRVNEVFFWVWYLEGWRDDWECGRRFGFPFSFYIIQLSKKALNFGSWLSSLGTSTNHAFNTQASFSERCYYPSSHISIYHFSALTYGNLKVGVFFVLMTQHLRFLITPAITTVWLGLVIFKWLSGDNFLLNFLLVRTTARRFDILF